PEAHRARDPRETQPRRLLQARDALLSCSSVRVRHRGRPAAAADPRPELRALQDLRHQGPEAEHRVGRARRRRRPELPEHVRMRMAKGGTRMKTVAELLKAKPARVVSVRPEQSVLEAIKVLAAEDIGAAIVMTGERLAGIFSERDYTRKVILKGRSSDTTRVEEIMTPHVV